MLARLLIVNNQSFFPLVFMRWLPVENPELVVLETIGDIMLLYEMGY